MTKLQKKRIPYLYFHISKEIGKNFQKEAILGTREMKWEIFWEIFQIMIENEKEFKIWNDEKKNDISDSFKLSFKII